MRNLREYYKSKGTTARSDVFYCSMCGFYCVEELRDGHHCKGCAEERRIYKITTDGIQRQLNKKKLPWYRGDELWKTRK